ncbi:hypothetical protein ACWDSL_08630 [Streptomyces sp. NPDC000941]
MPVVQFVRVFDPYAERLDNEILPRLSAQVRADAQLHVAMDTATNPASRWLFPSRRAGQPFRPDHLSALLNKVGVTAAAARGAAIRQQLLEIPAPVVADALGYHDKTTTRILRETGGTWSRYASGDHLQSPSGWPPQSPGAGTRPGSAE